MYRQKNDGSLGLRLGRVAILSATVMALGAATGYHLEGDGGLTFLTGPAEAGELQPETHELDGFLVNVAGLNMLITDVNAKIRPGHNPGSESDIRDAVLWVLNSASNMPIVEGDSDREDAFKNVVATIQDQGPAFLMGVDFEISETRMRG